MLDTQLFFLHENMYRYAKYVWINKYCWLSWFPINCVFIFQFEHLKCTPAYIKVYYHFKNYEISYYMHKQDYFSSIWFSLCNFINDKVNIWTFCRFLIILTYLINVLMDYTAHLFSSILIYLIVLIDTFVFFVYKMNQKIILNNGKNVYYRFQRKENNVGKRPQKQNAPEKESLSLHLAPLFV